MYGDDHMGKAGCVQCGGDDPLLLSLLHQPPEKPGELGVQTGSGHIGLEQMNNRSVIL